MNMHDDGQYINEILNGDAERAIYALVQKYENQIYNLCFRIIKNREVAEEVAQDSFLKSFKELKKLEDTSKYEIWLNRIAYHLSIDMTRKKKWQFTDIEQVRLPAMGNASSENLAHLDRCQAIDHVLGELSSEDAGLITLFYLNEMSVKEVAEVAKLSESNVKVKLLRIRKLLKEHLNEQFRDEVYDLY
jgi:RNA polymerase sigma-70 factor (ECF subfamily)